MDTVANVLGALRLVAPSERETSHFGAWWGCFDFCIPFTPGEFVLIPGQGIEVAGTQPEQNFHRFPPFS